MVNLKEKFDNLDLSDMALDIVQNYGGSNCLCDVITEVADQNVDCYNSDLAEWFAKNYHYVNEAVREFGIDERNFDIWSVIRQGQYYYNERELYEQEKKIWLATALHHLINNNVEELEEEIYERLEDECDSLDSNDLLQCIIGWCDENILNSVQ